MFSDSTEVDFVFEVDSEDTSVIVGTLRFIAVFSAGVVSETAHSFAESFEEFLKVRFMETAELRQSFVVVRECYETVLFVELCFMYASHGPLSRFLQAAADALSAWETQVSRIW